MHGHTVMVLENCGWGSGRGIQHFQLCIHFPFRLGLARLLLRRGRPGPASEIQCHHAQRSLQQQQRWAFSEEKRHFDGHNVLDGPPARSPQVGRHVHLEPLSRLLAAAHPHPVRRRHPGTRSLVEVRRHPHWYRSPAVGSSWRPRAPRALLTWPSKLAAETGVG